MIQVWKLAGRLRKLLSENEAFCLAVALKASVAETRPLNLRKDAVKEIALAVGLGDSNHVLSRLMSFSCCPYKNFHASGLSELWEMAMFRHCLGVIFEADAVASTTKLAE